MIVVKKTDGNGGNKTIDALIVMGGEKNHTRSNTAYEFFKKNYLLKEKVDSGMEYIKVPKLIFTGGVISKDAKEETGEIISESEEMRKNIIKKVISENLLTEYNQINPGNYEKVYKTEKIQDFIQKYIRIENKSRDHIGNLFFAWKHLDDKEFLNHDKRLAIALVADNYNMKRCYETAENIYGNDYDIFILPTGIMDFSHKTRIQEMVLSYCWNHDFKHLNLEPGDRKSWAMYMEHTHPLHTENPPKKLKPLVPHMYYRGIQISGQKNQRELV